MSTLKNYEENNVKILADLTASSPKKSLFYVNRDQLIHRLFLTLVLEQYVQSKKSVLNPVKCLDALGATGLTGILWKKHLGDGVDVIINDEKKAACDLITENGAKNNVKIFVTNQNPCALLHSSGFNFVYLDSNTETTFYLDAAFKNIARNALLVVTTRDDASIQPSNPDVAMRRYSGRIVRTSYYVEMGIRLVIAAMVRSAAKYNKGIKVLCCLSHKSTFTLAVLVQKGPQIALEALSRVRLLTHCLACQDREFQPPATGFPVASKCNLKSKCLNDEEHTIQELGPFWAGSIFDCDFIQGMRDSKLLTDLKLKATLDLILEEARCPSAMDSIPEKRRKLESEEGAPCFYYNLHKQQSRSSAPLHKGIKQVVDELRKMGFRASRTHFDPLAVRTNAPIDLINRVVVVNKK